jgi:hypothetical protein
VLTQRGSNGGTWVGFTSRNLQLDISQYFLCHDGLLLGANAGSKILLPWHYLIQQI